MAEIQRLAKGDRIPVGEWVRRTLRDARMRKPATDRETKLKAVRRAAEFGFPTSDIEQMLDEIGRGYRD